MVPQPRDSQLADVSGMRRDDLVRAILTIDCGFPVDFTTGQLRAMSTEKLRHVYLALTLRADRGARRPRKPAN